MTFAKRLFIPLVTASLLSACAADDLPTAESEAALTSLCGRMPSIRVCQVATCISEDRSWEIDNLPQGTPCTQSGTSGTCNANGYCILPPPPPVPSPPTNVTVVDRGGHWFTAAWGGGAGATWFHVVLTNGASFGFTGSVGQITQLVPATPYCFTVTAVNAAGESAPAPQVCTTTTNATDILAAGPFLVGFPYDMNAYPDQQPPGGGTLLSLEVPVANNDPRLIAFYPYGPGEVFTGCNTTNRIGIGLGGSINWNLLSQIYGTQFPLLRDATGNPLPIRGCATFAGGVQDSVAIRVIENYSTP